MSVLRACTYLLVLSVNLYLTVGKPLFGGELWCDLFCDDDDDDVSTSSTTTSTEDFFDMFDICGGCPTRRPATVRPNRMPPLNLMIPPMNGMGVSVSNANGAWNMSLIPWNSPPGGGATMPPPAATTAAATTAGTGGTTAATTTTKKA